MKAATIVLLVALLFVLPAAAETGELLLPDGQLATGAAMLEDELLVLTQEALWGWAAGNPEPRMLPDLDFFSNPQALLCPCWWEAERVPGRLTR